MVIVGGGFAVVCLALRWLLTKMGTPGTGKTEELSTLDPTYGLTKPLLNIDGTPMIGNLDLNGNAYGVTSQ